MPASATGAAVAVLPLSDTMTRRARTLLGRMAAMARKRKPEQRMLFDPVGGIEQPQSEAQKLYPRACPSCGKNGMHYYFSDGRKPIESWCPRCNRRAVMKDGQWQALDRPEKGA